ncbi:hypothetical protein TpMuguga_04g00849 [Theileria parva strain Muguga]|uniref:Uncharacterized protein n=1 Tax=Theileria parva TaxID=5875 RepID=Q4N197_THEPA|nr:uncharacterized protein TpMuguga_04g00849 [Theileria parva strain Muguga]EAN32203.1 hypothetical protein TpMuguga_04g00849 [Theileria parva strain Muguga]|eukprot:XP_764486.1 hypothetical protein [Theileria parva strain Muguga]
METKKDEKEFTTSSESSKREKTLDCEVKSEKVMVPFFNGDTPEFNPSVKNTKGHSQRFKQQNPENYHPKGRRYPPKKSFKPPTTKEIGLNSQPITEKPAKFKQSSPRPKAKTKTDFNEYYEDNLGHRISYIDKSNVGNIRPIDKLYTKPEENPSKSSDEGSDTSDDLLKNLEVDFKQGLSYCLESSSNKNETFVDALIRNSNTFEDLVIEQPNERKPDKSSELKSVLKKMGILDKSHGDKDILDLDGNENGNGKHYVFPKYMSSPDPSNLPIPGSL